MSAAGPIGLIGTSGHAHGPHLHFEVWPNGTNRVDPTPWLAARGINVGPFTG